MIQITLRNELIRHARPLSLSSPPPPSFSRLVLFADSLHRWPAIIIRVFARNKYQRSHDRPECHAYRDPARIFRFDATCTEWWLFRQSPSPSTVSILSTMTRGRVYQIFDIRNSHLAGGQVWRCPLALDTFGKSFRRNIIQRGVKLQPRWPVGRAGRIFQLTTLFRSGYGPMQVACTDTPVRAAFVVPFGFYERVACRRSDLLAPSPPSPLPPFHSVWTLGDFFFTSFAARINRRPQRSETRFRYSATVWKTL